jgi:hypothetical protein
VRSARASLEREATMRGARLDDLATTLIVAVVTDEGLAVASIGDGVVAVRRSSGDLEAPVPPQRGEYANESTFATSGAELPEPMSADFCDGEVEAFALSSDGLRLIITSDSTRGVPYEPFFTDLFAAVTSGLTTEALERFLEQADDRTGDDLSLVAGVVIRS